jgi:solute carrier family 13 (sodium-dependent dicarboxylate transporter), member 2/3/5
MTIKRGIALLAGPLVALPFLSGALLGDSNALACKMLGVSIWMALYWLTQPIPLAATSFLPLILYPPLAIMSPGAVASMYFNDTIVLFIGTFVLGIALEKYNLHRRVALSLLLRIGNRPRALLGGFMLITMLLSAFMSNTATTSVMAPLVMSIYQTMCDETCHDRQIVAVGRRNSNEDRNFDSDDLIAEEEETEDADADDVDDNASLSLLIASGDESEASDDDRRAHFRVYGCSLMLGVAYAANIGGTSTIVGTGPNLIFLTVFRVMFPEGADLISFARWFAFGVPFAICFVLFTWLYLVLVSLRGVAVRFDMRNFRAEYGKLGPLRAEEAMVGGVMLTVMLLWFTRTVWQDLFPMRPGDGTIVMAGALLLFVWQLVKWQPDLRDLQWNVIVLLGGGFAMAAGFIRSHLSSLIGAQLAIFGHLPLAVLIGIICTIITFTTELASNNATANIMLPILGTLAVEIGINPLLLMIPATFASSFAFMLPVATPPNAIVFAYRLVAVGDMARAGLVLNIVSIFFMTAYMLTYGCWIWQIDLSSPPAWSA